MSPPTYSWPGNSPQTQDDFPSRELWPSSSCSYPAWADGLWDSGSTVPQNIASPSFTAQLFDEVMSHQDPYTLPFDEIMEPNNYTNLINVTPPPSWMEPTSSPPVAHHQQPTNLHDPEHSASTSTASAPAVIRPTVGTPATLASSDRRRKHPRKHACHVCGNKLTSAANRDRHVRAHYGIKVFVCLCGAAFTSKADLRRHRKSSRCLFPGRV
ncbi:hypothetical protein AB1N83_012952 [Pleurotus pulmonarius]